MLLRQIKLLDFALNRMLDEGRINVLISEKGMHIIDLNRRFSLDQERLDKEIMTN